MYSRMATLFSRLSHRFARQFHRQRSAVGATTALTKPYLHFDAFNPPGRKSPDALYRLVASALRIYHPEYDRKLKQGKRREQRNPEQDKTTNEGVLQKYLDTSHYHLVLIGEEDTHVYHRTELARKLGHEGESEFAFGSGVISIRSATEDVDWFELLLQKRSQYPPAVKFVVWIATDRPFIVRWPYVPHGLRTIEFHGLRDSENKPWVTWHAKSAKGSIGDIHDIIFETAVEDVREWSGRPVSESQTSGRSTRVGESCNGESRASSIGQNGAIRGREKFRGQQTDDPTRPASSISRRQESRHSESNLGFSENDPKAKLNKGTEPKVVVSGENNNAEVLVDNAGDLASGQLESSSPTKGNNQGHQNVGMDERLSASARDERSQSE